jgi:hypothetical protein
VPVSYVPPASNSTAQAPPIVPGVGLSGSSSNLDIEHHDVQQTCEYPIISAFSITNFLAYDQLAHIPENDTGFNHTRPHLDSSNDFVFSGMANTPPPSQYINVEPEEEEMYGGEGDMTIRAAQDTDVLRALKFYQ